MHKSDTSSMLLDILRRGPSSRVVVLLGVVTIGVRCSSHASPWLTQADTWGLRDVEAAVAAVPKVLEDVKWTGPVVDVSRFYVVGHSNGGQGTWFLLTHKPDRVLAAAPVSGYSSIQAYVSYNLWTEMDPHIWACLQSSLASYRHEILMSNSAGISILQQHGSLDDNVPPFHSRRLAQLLELSDSNSEYHELPGKGHWFDGTMVSTPMRTFYDRIGDVEFLPVLPGRFKTVVPHSADMGSRGGIKVDQLISPDYMGSVEVDRSSEPGCWKLTTRNVRRLHCALTDADLPRPIELNIDGTVVSFDDFASQPLRRCSDGSWKVRSASCMSFVANPRSSSSWTPRRKTFANAKEPRWGLWTQFSAPKALF